MLSLRASASRSARQCLLLAPTHHTSASAVASAAAAARLVPSLAACQARAATATSVRSSLSACGAVTTALARSFHATAAPSSDAAQQQQPDAAADTSPAVAAEGSADNNADGAVDDSASASSGAADDAPRKRSSFKIYTSLSERKAAILAETAKRREAEQLLQARREAEGEEEEDIDGEYGALAAAQKRKQKGKPSHHAAEEDVFEVEDVDLSAGPDGDAASLAAAEAAAERATLQDTQLRGIAAKRLALQRVHPLKMFITSPAHGLDRLRVLPTALTRGVDRLLADNRFVAGQNDQLRRSNYALWHVANRSASEFAVLVRVFDEVVKRMPSLRPSSVMDYGSATQMGLWALQESLNKYANRLDSLEGGQPGAGPLVAPIKHYRAVEANTDLARYGAQLTEQLVQDEEINVQRRAHLPPPPRSPLASASNVDGAGETAPAAAVAPVTVERSEVVLAAFSLGLEANIAKRARVLDTLWGSVAPGGVLVLVEAGTIEGFETVRLAREYILDHYSATRAHKTNKVEDAAHVLAPCGSNGVCPMGNKSLKRSCWFRTEILSSSLPLRTPDKHLRTKAGVTVESFSYVVLTRGPVRVREEDARAALRKWSPKDKDIWQEEQQSAIAQARRDTEEVRAELIRRQQEEEEERLAAEQQQQAEENSDEALQRHQAADEFNAATAASAEAAHPASAGADDANPLNDDNDAATEDAAPERETTPVTKRTDLSALAHLLPSEGASPSALFEHAHYARILRKPLKRGEHVLLDLCNEASVLERRVVAKSYGIPYTLARSVGEGDLWPMAKRVRAASDPPSRGMLRRQELAERKARRAARLAAMEASEAEAAESALKDEHAAIKQAKKSAKRTKIKEARDAAIEARGGDVRIPVKASERGAWEAAEEVARAEEAAQRELEEAGKEETEAALQARKVAMEEARRKRKEEEKATKQLRQQQEHQLASLRGPLVPSPPTAADEADPDFLATEAAAGGSIAPPADDVDGAAAGDTGADGASTMKDGSAAEAKKQKQLAKEKLLRATLARPASQMPAWMRPILAQTRRAPGGLEYVGPEPVELPRADGSRDFDEVGDEEGEYTFDLDPAVRAAKLAKLKTTPASMLTPIQAQELKRAAIVEARAAAKAEHVADKEARANSPLAFKRQATPSSSDAHEQEASSRNASSSLLHQGRAAPNDATPSADSASTPADPAAPIPGVPQPKWAKFRRIKSATAEPVVAKPFNTPSMPTLASHRSRSNNNQHMDRMGTDMAQHEERAWRDVLVEASKSDADAARTAAAASSSRNFFKQDQTASISSSLPSHLAALVDSAASSPHAQHLLALAAQARAERDERQRKSSQQFHIRQHWREKKAAQGASKTIAKGKRK